MTKMYKLLLQKFRDKKLTIALYYKGVHVWTFQRSRTKNYTLNECGINYYILYDDGVKIIFDTIKYIECRA